MDKQSIIGFVLIAVLLGVFAWVTRPSEEQLAAQQKYTDSIALIQAARQLAESQSQNKPESQLAATGVKDTLQADSVRNAKFGVFASAVEGSEEFTSLENEVLELVFSNKGGRIYKARLKDYMATDSLPLVLFDGEESRYGFNLVTADNRVLNTADLYFQPILGNDGKSVTMRLDLGNEQSLDFIYTLQPDDYMLQFDVQAKNFESVLAPNTNYLDMNWASEIRQQETGRKFEERYTQLYYKFKADDVEHLSESKDESKDLTGRVQWIAFKGQFFSSVFISEEGFTSVKLDSKVIADGKYLKDYGSQMVVGFDPKGADKTGFRIYLGPNHYATLKAYDKGTVGEEQLDLEQLVPLGSWIFRWINKWLILPMFNFFGSFINSYGLIILLMTIVVKLVLFPLTYKSYMSSAKMRVLRPQVEAINAKYPGQDKAMERQKATMALYSQAGASPMSGCIPMLLQMPILIALFMFFPSAIELRQESFLWAKDLSTYDAVITWDRYIPIITPYFGNHISLFCVLMTIVNIIYTKFNADATNTGQQQMPGMKYIMYMMPLMFLVFFNQYASGLTYYYLVSTLFTIIQTLLFRQFINEEKLLAKLEANKKKPKKKGGFMARLEEAQRKQEEVARQRAKVNSKKR